MSANGCRWRKTPLQGKGKSTQARSIHAFSTSWNDSLRPNLLRLDGSDSDHMRSP